MLPSPSGAGSRFRTIRRVGNHREIPVDVRVIAATNRDLYKAISAGTFREDLFYRLSVFSITLPPLRERRSDIPHITDRLLTQINRQFEQEEPGYTHKSLSASATAFVKQQPWPGNVRQLYNVLSQAAVLADGATLGRGDLASALGKFSLVGMILPGCSFSGVGRHCSVAEIPQSVEYSGCDADPAHQPTRMGYPTPCPVSYKSCPPS